MSARKEKRGEENNLLTSAVVNHPGCQAVHCASVTLKALNPKQMNERHKVDKAIPFIEPATVGGGCVIIPGIT